MFFCSCPPHPAVHAMHGHSTGEAHETHAVRRRHRRERAERHGHRQHHNHHLVEENYSTAVDAAYQRSQLASTAALIVPIVLTIFVFLLLCKGQRKKRNILLRDRPLDSLAEAPGSVNGSASGLTRRNCHADGNGGTGSPLVPDTCGPRAAGSPLRDRSRRVQAIFDVDDTIKSSGNYHIFGYTLGGVDSQYGRGSIYPGVAEFAYELSCFQLPVGEHPAPVAVLTARAKELGPTLKLRQSSSIVQEFTRVGEERGNPEWGIGWDKGCVLYGSVKEWVNVDDRGLRKFNNFRDILSSSDHPAVGGADRNAYILVGDTGEWDLHCGELMLEQFSSDVLAVFMHCVSADPESTSVPQDTVINARPVMYFKTYPGAARKAFQYDLLTREAMLRVCIAAEQQLHVLEEKHPQSSRWTDLHRDIELCKVMYHTHTPGSPL